MNKKTNQTNKKQFNLKEKPANPDERSTQLRCATIAFTMEDEDGMHDILHEDIDNCIDILVEATETILHP